jgi:hypothetical protein
MLETEAIFQIEIGFGAAKVGNDLNTRKCQAALNTPVQEATSGSN